MGERMLSAEELRLWDYVRSTQFNQPLGADQSISRTKPLQENELVGVTATLKESTAAIERQTNSLRRHWECLLPDTFKRQLRGCMQDLVTPIGHKDALELQRLQFAVREEIDSFESSFQSALEDVVQTKKTSERRLAQRLHDDDHVLDALQKLAPPHSAVVKCEMDPDLTALRLVERLVDLTCDEIRCRLDRIYLERLSEPLIHEDGLEEGLNIQEISLKSDLNSLQAEIRDVVAMSFSPLLNSLHKERQRQRASEDLENQSMLQTLFKSRQLLETAVDSLESFHSYRTSLNVLHATQKRISASISSTPAHECLFTPVAQELPIMEAASRALLRHVGVSNESFKDRRSFEHDLSNKVNRLRAPVFSHTSSTDESLRNILDMNNASSQLLSLKHLETSSQELLDTSLGALDGKIVFLKGTVEDLDLSRVGRSSKAKEHFVGTWA